MDSSIVAGILMASPTLVLPLPLSTRTWGAAVAVFATMALVAFWSIVWFNINTFMLASSTDPVYSTFTRLTLLLTVLGSLCVGYEIASTTGSLILIVIASLVAFVTYVRWAILSRQATGPGNYIPTPKRR